MHMQLLHAHSTTVLAQARPTMFCIRLVFLYFYISIYIYIVRRAVNHFLLVFCVFLRHALFPN